MSLGPSLTHKSGTYRSGEHGCQVVRVSDFRLRGQRPWHQVVSLSKAHQLAPPPHPISLVKLLT